MAIFVGSDTMAIAMRSIFYHLMKNLASYKKLVTEIDTTTQENSLSSPTIKFVEIVKLPYFVAYYKEGMRLHPSVGMSIPWNVPSSGKMILGWFYSKGSRVGVNAFVLHFNQDIFGKDADSWNLDRWLQPRAENMDRYMLHFGARLHTCVEKNV